MWLPPAAPPRQLRPLGQAPQPGSQAASWPRSPSRSSHTPANRAAREQQQPTLTLYSTTQTKRLSGMRKKLMMVERISSGTYALRYRRYGRYRRGAQGYGRRRRAVGGGRQPGGGSALARALKSPHHHHTTTASNPGTAHTSPPIATAAAHIKKTARSPATRAPTPAHGHHGGPEDAHQHLKQAEGHQLHLAVTRDAARAAGSERGARVCGWVGG